MKKIILGLVVATLLSTAAYAATTPAYTPGKTSSVDFESLSKADKIKLIETKHAESKARYDAKWKAMTDDDKIAQYEKRRQRFMTARNKTGATTPMAAQATQAAPATAPAVPATPAKQ